MSQPDQVLVTVMDGAQPGETGTSEFNSIEEVFLALEAPLLSYALRLLKEPAMAQDVVQEAFVRCHAEFKSVRDPRRWLFRTVHNLALNQHRRDSKVIPLHPPGGESSSVEFNLTDPQPLPDEYITRLEHIGLVRLSLGALDERSRELVRMKFDEDLSYKEMSARTGLTVSNIGYLLHHALKSIEAELAKSGVMS
ncbi:MAG TPA: sigma-70 family RNA polymerase sigma factor [Verrucomicrobiae bacterium]